VKKLLEQDYVLLSLDSKKHGDGTKVIAGLRAGKKGGGIPWMTILDGAGKELVTSDGPKGNVGCPAQPDEIVWFRTMLERTKSKLKDADLDTIERLNKEFAERWLKKKAG
jgi:hypothetical protein